MCQEIQAMDIRLVEICPLVCWIQICDFWFPLPCFCETQSRWMDDLRMRGSHREAWRGGVMVWGCFACYTVGDVFWIQGTLNQHGYHRFLQRYAIPSGLHLVGLSFSTGQWPSTPPGCVRAIWPRRRVMECCIKWPGLHNHPTSTQLRLSEGKTANKCSAYVGTPSRLLEKHSRWIWLRECQECAKLSSRKRVDTLKNLKYMLICLVYFIYLTGQVS